METARICEHCGQPLGPKAVQGLCPACLLKAGLGSGLETGAAGAPPPAPRPRGFVPPPLEQLAPLFPQLETLELVGQGGMGAVYRARQRQLDRLVALKILPMESAGDSAFAARFSREARALARLSHPNIVAVHDFGQAGGFCFFLMEFIEGVTLRHLLADRKLPPETALSLVPQICEALEYAHRQGVVHRDIKPENILVDKIGRVRIADFGLAKLADAELPSQRLTRPREVMGTPHYMAPEQIERPQEVDHRADIYSLGVVFYEMLTGELPLGKFQLPSQKAAVDARLDDVVLHALEKERERRYQHASEVKLDVETISGREAGGPLSAERKTTAFRSAAATAPGATGALPSWVWATRWTARILGTMVFAFFAMFIIAEGLPPLARQPEGVRLSTVGELLFLAGFVVGWRRDGLAAVLLLAGWTLFQIAENSLDWSFFHVVPVVAALYGLTWWALRGRQTVRLACVTGVFLAALLLGRLFCPTSVFLSGLVADSASGLPIRDATLTLLPLGPHSPGDPRAPNARTGSNGRFILYVGWYAKQRTLSIAAPGYEALTTSLGPRPFAQRRVARDFQLRRAAPRTTSAANAPLTDTLSEGPAAPPVAPEAVPPVVVQTAPASGAAAVDPALTEIRVTFSQTMRKAPALVFDAPAALQTGPPRWLADGRTCILPVKLQPGRFHALWLNGEKVQVFQGTNGLQAVPYLLSFETKP